MILDIFFTIFLVFLNGFFVAAEFAIVKVRASQIDLQASKGIRFAKFTKHIVENLDKYLSATQMGITIASLGLGWVGENVATTIILKFFHLLGYNADLALAHTIAVPAAFVLITVMHIIFGELGPKYYAISHPLKTAVMFSLPLHIFYIVF